MLLSDLQKLFQTTFFSIFKLEYETKEFYFIISH